MTRDLFIRVDSSIDIGSGQITRCLILANEMKQFFDQIIFITKNFNGNAIKLITKNGFKKEIIFSNADISDTDNEKILDYEFDAYETLKIIKKHTKSEKWILVDHYRLDSKWELIINNFSDKLLVIDDLADRNHNCDLLIDQNSFESRYDNLTPNNCKLLLGPKFAILGSEFLKMRSKMKQRSGSCKNFLISFGGTDPNNETIKASIAINKLKIKDMEVNVVVGISNPNTVEIKNFCLGKPNFRFHYQTDKMAELMSNSDLSLGAGGITSWERCCLGLPSLVSILSKDQEEVTTTLGKFGCAVNLGKAESVTADNYIKIIQSLDEDMLKQMSDNCLELVDGKGISRIKRIIESL
tara:strand:+ start:709 stop:1770 length:1062 start_codon:yes stop_codon:yes gene_type:complete